MSKSLLTVEILARPKPKQSARFTHKRVYQKQEIKNFQKNVAMHAMIEMRSAGYKITESEVFMETQFIYAFPKNRKKVLKNGATVIWKTTRPDCDNLIKGVKDALSRVVYKDDSLVCKSEQQKFYGEEDKIVIKIFSDFEMKKRSEV